MPRQIPPWTAPTLGGFLLRTAIHACGLAKLAQWLDVAPYTLDRYCNGRKPKRVIRELLWTSLQIRQIFWEIRLVGKTYPPTSDDFSNGAQDAHPGCDDVTASADEAEP